MRVSAVHKIAVLRANALGDYIFAIPALDALRAAYPQAEIVLLGRNWHQSFLAQRPGPIDRVVVVPYYPGVWDHPATDPAAQERFFAAMVEERFDLAIQIHGGGRNSNPFLQRLGARVTAGTRTSDAPPLDRWIPYVYYQSEIARYLEVVALVGADKWPLEARVALVQSDLDESYRVVPQDERPLVALHPGASDMRRWWPAAKFAALGDALAAHGARVVVTGTADERALVDSVVSTMQTEAQGVCDQLSLGGLAGLLARCAVVISNDSGPLHLAAAVGAATVGIFWCANLVTAGHLTRARHRPAIAWQTTCPVCGVPLMNSDYAQPMCNHSESWVAGIPVEEVSSAALDLMHTTRPPR